jgi:hypothetical protein
MIVFRWFMGVVGGFAVLMALLSLIFGLVTARDFWYDRARRFAQYTWMLALLWFNIEVWGRVAWTLVTWNA